MKATKSNQSKHFAMKESLRCMADGGEVRQLARNGMAKNFDPRARIDRQEAEAMGQAQPTETAKAAVVEKSNPDVKPTAWQKLKSVFGMAEGGAVMPRSLRCMEDGGYVCNDEEEGLDRAVLGPGEGFQASPNNLPPLGKGFRDGGVADYSRGGKVRGPGGPRDDKIPAMLSNGEYVLPADTVASVGKENLDALKDRTHRPSLRMAGGGPVESPMALFQASQLDHGTGAIPSNANSMATMGPAGPGSELRMGGAAKSISMADGGGVRELGGQFGYAGSGLSSAMTVPMVAEAGRFMGNGIDASRAIAKYAQADALGPKVANFDIGAAEKYIKLTGQAAKHEAASGFPVAKYIPAAAGIVGAGQSLMESPQQRDQYSRSVNMNNTPMQSTTADTLRTLGHVGNAMTGGVAGMAGQFIADHFPDQIDKVYSKTSPQPRAMMPVKSIRGYADGDYVEDPRRTPLGIDDASSMVNQYRPSNTTSMRFGNGSVLGAVNSAVTKGLDTESAAPTTMPEVQSPSIRALSSPAGQVASYPVPGISRVGNEYSGAGQATGQADTTDYKAELARMNAADAAGQNLRQSDAANIAANYVSPEDTLRARHNNTPIAGATNTNGQSVLRSGGWGYGMSPEDKVLATQRRGQDVGLEAAKAGHAVQLRGQDLAANTAANEQQVQLRGQSLANNLGMINAMRAYQMEQARFGLETQRFGLDTARAYQETRQQNTANYEKEMSRVFGLNTKDGNTMENNQRLTDAHNLIMGELNQRAEKTGRHLTIGDLRPEDQATLVKEAASLNLTKEAERGKLRALVRRFTGLGEYNEPTSISEGKPTAAEPGIFRDTLKTPSGEIGAQDYMYRNNPSGSVFNPFRWGENADLGRRQEVGKLMEDARKKKTLRSSE